MSYVTTVTKNGTKSPVTSSLYGTCSTADSTANKVVTCSDFDRLETGASIRVNFTYSNTANNATLNVNGTGAKSLRRGASSDIKWDAGSVIQFMYDGTYWQITGNKLPKREYTGAEIECISNDTIKIGDVVYTVGEGIICGEKLSAQPKTASFSPDGTKLVLGGAFSGYAKLYSVSGNTVNYLQDIYADSGTTALSSRPETASFSPDGTKLVLGGQFSRFAKLYSISGNTVTYLQDIYADSGATTLSSTVYTSSFSPDGTKLVLGGGFSGKAKLYSVSGNTVNYLQDIYADSGTTALSSTVNTSSFSPDGTKLVLGGQFTGKAKLYSISGNTVNYLQDIYADSGTTVLSSHVNSVTFSPDGTKLVLGGQFTGYAKIYSVSGNTISYLQNIYANAGTQALSGIVYTSSFSPDGTKLVLGGAFSGYARLYSVSGNTISYLQTMNGNVGTRSLSSYVYASSFSPDGTKLVLGGMIKQGAILYSVLEDSTNVLRYIGSGIEEYLGDFARTASFSPDGTKLVLGGDLIGYAKLYSVSGDTVTYLQDIKGDATFALSSTVYTSSFSPDGTKLVLGGNFSGYAKLYSVSGNTISYLGVIRSDSGTTVLSSTVYTSSFSPDGTKLVLGGAFSGYAKLYSVSGDTVTYLQDIYADSGTTALSAMAETASFSPDGTKLVLGGQFTGKAKLYSVSGNAVSYSKDIYSKNSDIFSLSFAPDGTKLVSGGDASKSASLYSVSGTSIEFIPYAVYSYNALTNFSDGFLALGLALNNSAPGENVRINKLIGGYID